MLSSFECCDQVFIKTFRSGNQEYKQAMCELLTLPEVVNVFKRLLKQNQRSFIRGEQSNQKQKIQVTLRLVTMYLNIGENQFYPICAREVSKEISDTQQEGDELGFNQKITYNKLMDAVDGIDWQRKKIEPNVKQVYKKLNPQQAENKTQTQEFAM